MSESVRLFMSCPEEAVAKPLIYDIVKEFDVVPNIRRADVEERSGWMILELSGEPDSVDAAVDHLREAGCVVNRMEGDVVAG